MPEVVVQQLLLGGDGEYLGHGQTVLLSESCEGDFVVQHGREVGVGGAAHCGGWHQLAGQSFIHTVLRHGDRHKQVHGFAAGNLPDSLPMAQEGSRDGRDLLAGRNCLEV